MSEHVTKHLKFNYALNLSEAAFWGLGAGLASTTAVIPLFLSKYTDSAILFGLIPAIQTIGFQLPQLFMAKQVAANRLVRPIVMKNTIHERIPYLGMALVALFADLLSPPWVVSLLFLMIIWQGFGGGITGNAWQIMITKVIPSDIRSMFFSIQGASVNFLTSTGAYFAGVLLERNSTNFGYFLCFLFGFIAMATSYALLGNVKEESSTEIEDLDRSEPILKSAITILQSDKDFRSFVLVRFLIPFSTMASAFFTIYVIKYFNASEITVGYMTSLLFISTVISGLILGWISDHIGRKFAMLISLAIMTVTAFLAYFGNSLEVFYAVFILTGVINGSFWSVFLSFSLEFGDNKTRPTYVGLVNTLIAPSTLFAQLLGGYLADTMSYKTTFATAGIFGILTFFITLVFVNIPKKRKALHPA